MSFGIDFGTSNCAVAVWSNDEARVVPFDAARLPAEWYGFGLERVFPSVFGYHRHDGTESFGWRAKLLADERQEAVKRLLAGHHQVTLGGQVFASTHVATKLFGAMRAGMREAGLDVDEAVVTVPAKATGQARYRTRQAAHRAGLRTLSLINEPTAAAMAYVDAVREPGRFLVYDWGGGTVDVTVLEYAGDVLVERASSGRTDLGGIDIDTALRREVRAQLTGTEKWQDHHLRQFELEVEKAKILLSSEESAFVISPLGDEVVNIDREAFELLVSGLVERTMTPVDEVMRDLDLEPDDIDAVVMVGGSSRIPLARRALERRLDQDVVSDGLIDPLTAVAQGAAFAAAALRGEVDEVISVVTANALGTKVRDEGRLTFSPIIHRNSSLPFKASKTYRPSADVVRHIDVDVWEGDPDKPLTDSYNQLLHRLRIPLDEPTPRDDARFSLEFTYGDDGTVSVRAELVKTGTVLRDGPIDIFQPDEREAEFTEDNGHVPPSPTKAAVHAHQPTKTGNSPPAAPRPAPPKPTPPPPRPTSAVVLVVDGSNLAWVGRSRAAGQGPSIAALTSALEQLLLSYPAADIKVVVDANLRHLVHDPGERAVLDEALTSGRWMQPPAGTVGAGDALILAVADVTNGLVVSNDSYREFQAQYPWLTSGNRLLGATEAGAGVWLFLRRKPPTGARTPATGPAAIAEPQPSTAGTAQLPAGWEQSGWKAQTRLSEPPRRAADAFGPVSDNYYETPLDSK